MGDPETIASKHAESIVLFADGTGNSSAKLFKTNVYRMYQAIDLGPNDKGLPVQVAYYDNGIGTQSIRPLAMLAGIFGIGLKANVLRLYRFACRNAINRDGDAVASFYCFGFSRGAFTIRLVAAMLAKYGVVQYQSEAELEARTLDTFRDFMSTNNPNMAGWVGRFGRAVRNGALAAKRAVFGPHLTGAPKYREVQVEFVGVWDTVAAYGGPIAEITRGIDDYIWPLSMTDSCLNSRIKVARHAVAIDDERDSFHPVLWDEVNWHEQAVKRHPGDEAAQAVFKERLKQVWFAGMHSDVGGGYPDESLSYVSLVWMMDEAEKAGLRLLPEHKKAVRDLSNSLGPIHDSRAGLGAYYRPQPRKVAAFLHPKSGMNFEDETLSHRDPVLGELPKPPHGVLLGCRIHESVVARLVEGTDDYAPTILPPQVSVEPYSTGARTGGNAVVPPSVIHRISQPDPAWYDCQERIWDRVLWRRVAYFGTVACTFLLVSMPLWAGSFPYPESIDDRAVMQRLTSWSRYAPVDWIKPWIDAFETNWIVFFALLFGALGLSRWGKAMLKRAQGESYRLWQERLHGKAGQGYSLPGRGWVTRLRTGKVYQRALQILKWRLLPLLAAILLVLAGVWAVLAVLTQAAWSFAERTECRSSGRPIVAATQVLPFETDDLCSAKPLWVERGHRYHIEFTVTEPWTDKGIPASPGGVRARDLTLVQWLGMPFRRVIDGRYLQPIARLRPFEIDGEVPKTSVRLLNPLPVPHRPNHYVAVYEASDSGALYLFVNDAAFLGDRSFFYANNTGRAVVTMRDIDAAP